MRSAPATRIITILALLLIGAISVAITTHIRNRETTEARRELLSFSKLLAEQTARSVQSVELVQANIADELKSEGLTEPGDLERLASNHDMYERLRQRISGVPQLDAVTLISPDGQLVNFSRYWPIPSINIKDRDYFKALSQPDAPSSMWGEPVRSRANGSTTIYLAQRLTGDQGQFLGLVLGAIETGYFETLYRNLDLPLGYSIALWREDGLLLAHFPATDAVGRHFDLPFSLRGLRPGEHQISRGNLMLSGDDRLIATTRLPDQPVIVAVTRSMDSVLSDWRLDRIVIGASATAWSAAVLAIAWLVSRRFRAYETAADAMAAREQAERSLHQAEARLQQGQKMEAMGRLTAGVAHDFNNLLTIVRANAELLESALVESRAAQRLNTICQAADRGARLTRQMLAFSRQQILSPASVDVNERLQSITELLISSLGAQVRFGMSLAGDLFAAYVDAAQLEQAILNLVINARDAVAGGGTVTIETGNHHVSASAPTAGVVPGDYVRITVSDTGHGMTPDVMSRAFDPFFTTKEQGRGTGLGLSQVVGFARQSNGDVVLDSAPGQGTRASIILPRAARVPVAAENTIGFETETAVPTAPLSVLLVDDDAPVREGTASLLRRQGFRVVEAESGRQAIERLRHEPGLDVVLSDYAMPEISGTTMANEMREHAFPQPVVFFTGYTEPDILQAERWVVRKPFDADMLAKTLRRAWTEHRAAAMTPPV